MREKSLIKKNILQFLEYKKVAKPTFYKETGITRGILDQNNGLSEENLTRFLTTYPEVNAEWLILGKGEMLQFPNKKELVTDAASATFKGSISVPERTLPPTEKETDMSEKEIIEMQKGYIASLKFQVDTLTKENQALAKELKSSKSHGEVVKNM